LPPRTDGTEFAIRLLQETGVCVVPGDTFGETARNAWRISYSTSLENIEEAFARMRPWLEKQRFPT
jgi:aspartate/methionine/tyrosine aminotransferase